MINWTRYKSHSLNVKFQVNDKKFQSFDNAQLQLQLWKAEEAPLQFTCSEAKRISERARADITNLQASSQNALGQIEAFKTQYGTKLKRG